MITQKPGMVLVGAVILMVVVSAGCLGSTVQKPPVPCSITLAPGQNLTINETQDGATICAQPGSSLTLELTDAERVGDQWIINATPGLRITDEGITFYHYFINGTPLTEEDEKTYNGPGMEQDIDRWNVSMTNTGVQKITANLQYYVTSEPRTVRSLNWTIVVS